MNFFTNRKLSSICGSLKTAHSSADREIFTGGTGNFRTGVLGKT